MSQSMIESGLVRVQVDGVALPLPEPVCDRLRRFDGAGLTALPQIGSEFGFPQ